jgi:hypothetical protein
MANGYKMFAKLNPAGRLYRYKSGPAPYGSGWKPGTPYFLIKWERPEGIDKKSPLLNAHFLVNGEERIVDISFFKYLDQVE